MKIWFLLAVVLVIVTRLLEGCGGTGNREDGGYYVASVVEYSPVMSFTPQTRAGAQQIMQKNLDQYEKYMAQAAQAGTQIILFPEDGLYGAYFPDRDWALPYLETIPSVQQGQAVQICGENCFFDSPALSRAACLARRYQMYLVLNMGDLQPCNTTPSASEQCPADGRFQYNTLVAFNPAGALVAKYHKTNLYFEPEWNAGDGLPISFRSSFGVTFGLLICFDIMRPQPQLAIMADLAITDVLLSSWWVNVNPQIISTGQQQAWSRISRRNLLVAGIGRGFYNSGSGLYDHRGTILEAYYNPSSLFISKLLTHRVPVLSSAAPVAPPSGNYPLMPSSPPQDGPLVTITPFSPGPPGGASVTLVATAGSATCTAILLPLAYNASETFALVAQVGFYNSVFNATICSFNRCLSPSDCLSWISFSSSTFREVRLSLNVDPSPFLKMLPMIDVNGGQLYPNLVYQTSFYKSFPTTLTFAADFGDRPLPLLNMALFGVLP